MRKKTLEELRASARERARRWREKNARTHRERVKEVYGKSQAQARIEGGVAPNELERMAKNAFRPLQETENVSFDSIEADPRVLAEQQRRERIRRGLMEPEQKGGEVYGIQTQERRSAPTEDSLSGEETFQGEGGPSTAEERRIAEWLQARKPKAGVEVELIL